MCNLKHTVIWNWSTKLSRHVLVGTTPCSSVSNGDPRTELQRGSGWFVFSALCEHDNDMVVWSEINEVWGQYRDGLNHVGVTFEMAVSTWLYLTAVPRVIWEQLNISDHAVKASEATWEQLINLPVLIEPHSLTKNHLETFSHVTSARWSASVMIWGEKEVRGCDLSPVFGMWDFHRLPQNWNTDQWPSFMNDWQLQRSPLMWRTSLLTQNNHSAG